MLRIRQEQLEVFKPIAEEAFIGETVEYLRENYSDRTVHVPAGASAVSGLTDSTLRLMVQRGIERAHRYEINSRAGLKAFVVLMIVTAPNFDEHPLIRRILSDKKVAPDSRIDELWKRTVDQNWIAVRQSYDAEAWNLKGAVLTPQQETVFDATYGSPEPPVRVREFEKQGTKVIKNPTLRKVSEQEFLELETDKQYVWVIDKDGNLLVGESVPTGVLESDGYVQKLGVPTLTEGEAARIAGELLYINDKWILNNRSACYSVYPDRGPEQLENAAERFREAGQEIEVEFISLRSA